MPPRKVKNIGDVPDFVRRRISHYERSIRVALQKGDTRSVTRHANSLRAYKKRMGVS